MLCFIIDGYNLIKTQPELKSLVLAESRSRLIRRMEQFAGRLASPRRTVHVMVVFDGKEEVYSSARPSSIIKVIFTRREKADDYIKRFVQTHPQDTIKVVSNDREIRSACHKKNTESLTIGTFSRKVLDVLQTEPEQAIPAGRARTITQYVEEMLLKKYKNKE